MCLAIPVWRAVCTKRGPKKLPPIPTAITSFSDFPVAPTYQTVSHDCIIQAFVTQLFLISKKKIYYPGTTADFLRELLDLVQNFPNLWNNILSITVYDSISCSS